MVASILGFMKMICEYSKRTTIDYKVREEWKILF
jgi:hypothetical protein